MTAAALRLKSGRPLLMLCADEGEARRQAADLRSLTGREPVLLTGRELPWRELAAVSRQWEYRRLEALYRIRQEESPVIVTTADALALRCIPPQVLERCSFTLRSDGRYQVEELARRLTAAGYTCTEQVEGPGQFALRGGILDVYSPGAEAPVRCEFFDDEVDSLGFFDVATQRRTENCREALLLPAGEVLPDDIGTAWSGTSYQEANASKTGGLVYLLALVFVFLALAALYESWGLPLAILMSVPVAVLGAVLFIGVSHLLDAFFVNDVYMQISLVMLIGLAAKNAILVVEYADRLFNEKGLSLMDAAIGAAKLRVRPIIMTAFAFILGVMPLVFASGVYATARNIMGVALVGGMLFATLLGIFVYPALYYFVGRIGNFERRRERKKQEEKL